MNMQISPASTQSQPAPPDPRVMTDKTMLILADSLSGYCNIH